jgi:hypothetical protein
MVVKRSTGWLVNAGGRVWRAPVEKRGAGG